jgi:hypothetical protein
MVANQDLKSLLVLAGSSGSNPSPDQINEYGRGLILVINITAVLSGNVTVTIQGKDLATGQYYNLLASSAISGTGNTVLTVYPGCIASANSVANLPLPRTWRIVASVSNGGNITGKIGASVIL